MKSKNANTWGGVNAALLDLWSGGVGVGLVRCGECGKAYCPECAESTPR